MQTHLQCSARPARTTVALLEPLRTDAIFRVVPTVVARVDNPLAVYNKYSTYYYWQSRSEMDEGEIIEHA